MDNNEVPNEPAEIKEDKSILPFDIIEIILQRLPLKSLLRFKIVAKSWNDITTDPRFARMHLNQSKNSNSGNPQNLIRLWKSQDTGEYHLAKFGNHKFQTRSVFKFPCKEYEFSDVLCTCDGFLLLKSNKETEEQYVLWNPITKAYTMFFSPYPADPNRTTYGICYDRLTNDYKVVLVTEKSYAVFSYKNNSWSDRKEFPYTGISRDPGIFANGVLYWITIERDKSFTNMYINNHSGFNFLEFDQGGDGYTEFRVCPRYESDYSCAHEIVYFDPMDAEFKKFHKPDCVKKNHVIYLTTLRGSLCLYQNSYGKKCIRIWQLKDDIWTMYMSITNVPKPIPYLCLLVRPLCLTNNEIVLQYYCLYNDETKFIVYNYRKNNYSDIQNFFLGKHSNVITCLNSMVLPTRDIEASYSKLT